jgi:hypothetical protein
MAQAPPARLLTRRNRLPKPVFTARGFPFAEFAMFASLTGAWPINVGTGERVACGIAGAALLANGIRHPSIVNAGLAVLGGALLQRSATGHCALYQRLGIDTSGKPAAAERQDEVTEASADSFPASDPPAWTPTSSLGTPGARS